jgi:hypothetical protein
MGRSYGNIRSQINPPIHFSIQPIFQPGNANSHNFIHGDFVYQKSDMSHAM